MLINGHLMSKNKPIAKITDNEITVLNDNLLPLLLKRTMDLETWLNNRVIDKHRPGSRILRKMLRLTSSNDMKVIMKFNAVSLTDTYWIKEEGSTLTWEEAIACTDYFSSYLLDDEIDLYDNYEDKRTFELTNVGSYEKCWKHDTKHDKWIMIKKQLNYEVESEMIAYEVAKLLNIPVAKYFKISDTLIACENFVDNWEYNFEDAYSLVDEEEEVETNLRALYSVNPKLVVEYTWMKILDAIIMNVDRHTNNYGILRNVDTGEVVSMAPMFDHNMCLRGSKATLKMESPELFFSEVDMCVSLIKEKIVLPKLDMSDFQLSKDEVINRFLWSNYLRVKFLLNEIKRDEECADRWHY